MVFVIITPQLKRQFAIETNCYFIFLKAGIFCKFVVVVVVAAAAGGGGGGAAAAAWNNTNTYINKNINTDESYCVLPLGRL